MRAMHEQKRPTLTSIGPSWRVLKPLGRGSMGSVFLCEDRLLPGRLAAVKLLRHKVGDRERMSRFGRELEALERLSHPGIVSARGAGVDGSTGRLYLAMEYVEGPSLAKRIREGTLEPEEATRVFGVLFDAMFHAHVRDVHHRDIKPANIVLGVDGPRLVDFGIAMFGPEREGAELLGTPVYMAPEVLEGCGYDPAAADLHALGIVMFEALTGERPFEYDLNCEPEMAAAAILRDKQARTDLDPGKEVPDPLRTLVRGVTAADPAVRLVDRASIMRLLAEARSLLREACPDIGLDDPTTSPPVLFEPVDDDDADLALMPLLADEYARAHALQRDMVTDEEGDEVSAALSAFFVTRDAPATPATPDKSEEEEEVSGVVVAGIAVLLAAGLFGAALTSDRTQSEHVAAMASGMPGIEAAVARPVAPAAAMFDVPEPPPMSTVIVDEPYSVVEPEPEVEEAVAMVAEPTTKKRVVVEPRATPKEVALGTVYLSSEPPGASIKVDGAPLGRTPAEISLPMGSYTFALRKEGFKSSTQTVAVDESDNVVAMVLTPIPKKGPAPSITSTGPVLVSLAGWKGATLSVDGVEVGTLPVQLDLSAGWHEFRVQGEVGELLQRREVLLPAKGVAKVRLKR